MGYGMEEYNMALDGVQMGLVLGHYCRGLNSCHFHSRVAVVEPPCGAAQAAM